MKQSQLASKNSNNDEGRLQPVSGDKSAGLSSAVEAVRSAIASRKSRADFFSGALFADPAWDMLLELFQAELEQTRVSTSKLCAAAAVPYTTALRWLNTLTDDGLLVRRDDPIDKRRVFIELAPASSEAMRRYFVAVAKQDG